MSDSQLLIESVRFNITSDYDYCSLCAVCASTYELSESELSLGRLSNMLC